MANLTDKQEKFARAIFQGKSQYEAYLEAYPASKKWQRNSVDCKASLMANDEKIMQRVHNLRAPVVRELQYGVKEAMEEAHRAYVLAMAIDQPGAATQAVTLRSKLNGLLIERKEVTVTKMDGMTPEEKQLVIEAAKAEVARRAQAKLTGPDDVTDVEAK